MTEQEIERCLERLSTCKATDVMNFDYAGTLAYIERLKAENATLRERLGKWAVDNEIVMEPRVKDGQTYYVISRKERRIVTHYICTELTPEAAEARLSELKGE